MKVFVENSHAMLWFCLNIIRWVGFLVPDELSGFMKMIYPLYAFSWYVFLIGIYVVTQTGCLIQVWGDLGEMTNASFLLFTNLVMTAKILNVMLRRRAILDIINQGDGVMRNETRAKGRAIIDSASMDNRKLLYFYVFITTVTCVGWAIGAETNQLPLRAWYPYDTTKSPAYEIIYVHQSVAVVLLAVVNIGLDQLVTSLVSVCRARLRLVNLSLRTLSENMDITYELLTCEQEKVFSKRLRTCILQHQAALESAVQIQNCFSEPIYAQFSVSMVIICVTAYQLAVEVNNSYLRMVSMTSYLICMIIQVFVYCYQGNHLTVEWYEITEAVYECPWYLCSIPLRRSLLIMMIRSKNALELTAGGIMTLSLKSFTSIINASYSFFTVLQQVEQ